MVTEIHAPAASIWDVLMEPLYIPKLYPNILTAKTDPPGRTVVGQKFHLVGQAGRRRLEIFAETTELIEGRKVSTRQAPGGMFKTFQSSIALEPKSVDVTTVLTSFEYELSMGYLGKVFNLVLLERLVTDNLKAYARNLKEISELLPVPAKDEKTS